jgi:cytochrome b
MNTASASPTDPRRPGTGTSTSASINTSTSTGDAPTTAAAPTVLVWDAPVRLFHWLAVLSFAGAYLSAESERWRLLHVTLGYTLAGLVLFRIVWGLLGTRYARFGSFVRGPRAVAGYLRGITRGDGAQHIGHNPAGALAILAMLALALAITASGWAVYTQTGGEWLEEAHEFAANTMVGVIGLHLVGVLLASWRHQENLVGSMFSGRKRGLPEDGIGSAWTSVAALMLVAVLGFWAWQWHSAPAAGSAAAPASTAAKAGGHDDD